MKKVAIIGTAGVPAKYGGFETLAHHLVNNFNDDFDLTVYCSTKFYPKNERVKRWNKARLIYIPLNANGSQSILYDIISIFHALFYADSLVVLGVSGGIIIPFVKIFTKKNIIVNIDGLEWRRDKWGKLIKKFLKFSEILAVKFSDADITDNESIKRYTAINYKTLSHRIEYGADHVISAELEQSDYDKYVFLKEPYAFKVCRIEPENNVHLILEAFASISDKTLVMVGNWKNSEYGIEQKTKYSNCKNIFLLDPIYDQLSLDKLRSNCSVYVHGHSAGGTNPSLVEAMYLGLPIIAYNVSYNYETTEGQAFFFRNQNDLQKILNTKSETEFHLNGERMKEIAKRRYTWEIIASKYGNLINGFDYGYVKKSTYSKLSSLSYKMLKKNGLAHMKKPIMFYEEAKHKNN